MTKYVLKRILLMFFVLFVITTMEFVLIRMLPRELPTDKVQAAAIQERWTALGYDEPLLVQFGIYIKELFKGDFGVSLKNGREISSIISESFPISCKVGLRAISIALICGTVFGSIAALMRA